MTSIRIFPLLFALSLTVTLSSQAATQTFETEHQLSVGAGYSSPSRILALYENPTGLGYNQDFLVVAQAKTPSLNFEPMGGSLGLYLGNGFVGGALDFDLARYASGSTAGALTAGIGITIPSAYFGLGVSGSYSLWNSTGASNLVGGGGVWGLNSGLLINPNGEIRGGLVANQLGTGAEYLGAGIAWSPSGWATLTVDGSKAIRGSGIGFKPGLGIHFFNFQMSLGWGVPLQTGLLGMRTGPDLGLGFRFNQNVHLQAYYNHLTLLQVSLLIQI